MECRIHDAVVHYVARGTGPPVVALHGAGVDHRELLAAIDPMIPAPGYRRIYPDLPGMGRSTAANLAGNDDVADLLVDFLAHLDAGPAVLLGHSYGAYLARGVLARRPDLVRGLALLCPIAERAQHVPEHTVVRQDPDTYDQLDAALRAGFDEYFVVRTAATARRYRDHVAPGTRLADETALGRIFSSWKVDVGPGPYPVPTLIAAGRQDSVVGYAGAAELLEHYPHATMTIADGAGHALPHERPALLATLIADWLDRSTDTAH